MDTPITKMLNIKYPLLVAPMFLISNEKMLINAINKGVTAAIPAANFKNVDELAMLIDKLKSHESNAFGVNIIVNKSNLQYREQLITVLNHKPDYVITSLGNPKEIISKCKPMGIKVFCDVVDIKYAQKVQSLGADAIIAVCKEAGGHAGNIPAKDFIPELKEHCKIPIIAAGGVANNIHFENMLELGADAVSAGTVFLAAEEANISDEYRAAIIKYGAKDIVRTTKMSGAPLTVINTPYVQKIGLKANPLEKILNNNKRLKSFAKKQIMKRGAKQLEKAAFSATYRNVWCAGPAIEYIQKIRPIAEIIDDIVIS
ncbi:MAG: nitronate monooxygenase [Bacteroidales bacterium]|nr:nitronate monooxygenase [Bacteroidales bacterium]